MKINHFNSTSSSSIRLIKFLISKLKTRIILGFISVGLLTACTAPTAMLGPAYTLSSPGNIFQTGYSY